MSTKTKVFSISIFLILICVARIQAQGDTVHFRMLTTILNDSTRIGYEIGAVGYKHSGTLRYLQFQTSASTVDSFFLTRPFYFQSLGDSLFFCRFGTLDNKDFWHIDTTASIESVIDSSVYSQVFLHYDSLGGIHPSNLAFDAYSTGVFIIELRSYPGNTILYRIDTLKFYKNGSGELRWYNIPVSLSKRGIQIPSSLVGDTLMISVRPIFSLPIGAFIRDSLMDVYLHNKPCSSGDYSYSGQDWPTIPPPILDFDQINNKFLISITPNPTFGKFRIIAKGIHSGILHFEITNALGITVDRFKKNIYEGTNSFEINCSTFPNGNYFIRVASNSFVSSYPLIIEK
jgi:hypothetical protein